MTDEPTSRTPNTLVILRDRIWQRRWLVTAIALVATFGAYLTAHGHATTYTSRVLVSAASTRPPTQDAILAQGYTYYLNDPTYQAGLRQKQGFPSDIDGFSAEFVTASPLFYIQVIAATPSAATTAAPQIAQLYIDDINGRLDASRSATAADMTAAMLRVWGDRLTASDPSAYTAQIQLQQQIDQLNSNEANRLTILQSGAGAMAIGPGKTRKLATGMVGGVILGCVVALMAGASTRRLYNDYDVVEKTGIRPFDVIPPGGSPARDARREVAVRHVSNLVARAATHSPTSIAVVPVSSGRGADHIARAIAEQRAAQGSRTVFVNADLRTADYGPRQRGVAEYLRGLVGNVHDLVRQSGSGGFAEISAGEATADPYPLFDRDRVRELLRTAGEKADLVIIAVPPISSAPESQIVADIADQTVLIIERGHSRVREVDEAVRAINQVGAQVLGALFVDTAEYRPAVWDRLRRSGRSRTTP
ncbi:hypothetical protein GFY24_12555 [Nocardia sp. SYP-A9097]|uniref:CpsD/CapB family tyrosine-protein kinase n=1 Tax=Nocardia sp. SYP-A9097 TaxID=2663237 RepID=UPI00129A66E5|nr:CpsD/CapB family tyrosine-protein kinase [Nocardia sp. SYP-A9097]MRH88265.1 hypothetical protein [Nocardia sp. SYP-A9097]